MGRRILILHIFSALITATALAQSTTGTNEKTGNGATNPGTTNIPGSIPNANQPSMNQSANQGASSQYMAAGIDGAVGVGLFIYYESNCPGTGAANSCWAGPMAAMALLQAVTSLATAGQSGDTGAATTGGTYGNSPYTYPSSTPYTYPSGSYGNSGLSSTGGTITPQQALSTLNAQGVSADPAAGTVTAPDVGTQPMSNFSSPGALAGAGYSPSQIAAATAELDKLNKQAAADAPHVLAVGVDTSGGGGGLGAGDDAGNNAMNSYLATLRRGLSSLQKAKMAAGKSLLAKGQPIGVKGDDIFQMIHRRYDTKKQGNEFLR
jgi:hypothetical protein